MKNKIRKILMVLLWGVMLAGVVVILAWADIKKTHQHISELEITIYPQKDAFFVDQDVVKSIINKGGTVDIKTKERENVDVAQMEFLLEQNPYIRNAEVFIDVDGKMSVNVYQKTPLARVFSSDGSSYYLDEEGYKIPLSENYTARVMVCNGSIDEKYNKIDTPGTWIVKNLYSIAHCVEKNPFWKAQIEQIFVNTDHDFLLIPKVGSHQINIGDGNDVEEKLEKLFVFYKNGLDNVGWEKYKSINLKYDGQIVCEKRIAEPVVAVVPKAVPQQMQPIVKPEKKPDVKKPSEPVKAKKKKRKASTPH